MTAPAAARPIAELSEVTGAPTLARTDVPPSLTEKMQLADQLAMAQGSLFPDWLRGRAANFVAVMYAAQSLDVPFWVAAQGLYAEGGSVGMEAWLMRALVQRAGHLIYTEDSSPFHATVTVIRRGMPARPYRATFTIEEAVRAGIAMNENYLRYPEAQMVARATSRVCRDAASDALAGFAYLPEEIGAGIDVEPVPATPVAAEQSVVDKLCAQLDQVSDLPGIKRVWKAASKANALTAVCDGEPLVARLQAKFAEVAPSGMPAPAPAASSDGASAAAVPVTATASVLIPAPTPPGTVTVNGDTGPALPCGCPESLLLSSGTHAAECEHYTAPAPETPKRAPTPKAAPSKAAKAAPRKAAPRRKAGKG